MKIHPETSSIGVLTLALGAATLYNAIHPFDVFGYHATPFLLPVCLLLIGVRLCVGSHRHHNRNDKDKP